jgi:hypothetical protein
MEKTRKSGSIVELSYVTTILGPNDKVLKRKVRAKLTCDVDDIKVVDYCFNNKGELDPSQCKIYHEPLGWMIIDAPYEKLHELKMTGNIAVAGFQQKKERNKTIKNFNKYGRNYQLGS